MIPFILRRLVLVFFTIWVLTLLAFAVIQLPPGDMLTTYVLDLEAGGHRYASIEGSGQVAIDQGNRLREYYGLDKP